MLLAHQESSMSEFLWQQLNELIKGNVQGDAY